jgi:hypothetical protein
MPARRTVRSRSLDVTFEPAPQHCTKCRASMVLARIEPAKSGFDLRTFECTKCNNVDQYIIELETIAPWVLHVRPSLQMEPAGSNRRMDGR